MILFFDYWTLAALLCLSHFLASCSLQPVFCDWLFLFTTYVICSKRVDPLLCSSSCKSDVKHLASLHFVIFQWHLAENCGQQHWEKNAGLLTAGSDWLQQNILFFLANCSRTSGLLEQCAIRTAETLPCHWTIVANWRFGCSICRGLRVPIAWKKFWFVNCKIRQQSFEDTVSAPEKTPKEWKPE